MSLSNHERLPPARSMAARGQSLLPIAVKVTKNACPCTPLHPAVLATGGRHRTSHGRDAHASPKVRCSAATSARCSAPRRVAVRTNHDASKRPRWKNVPATCIWCGNFGGHCWPTVSNVRTGSSASDSRLGFVLLSRQPAYLASNKQINGVRAWRRRIEKIL